MSDHGPQVVNLVYLGKLWVLMNCRVEGIPERGPCSKLAIKGLNFILVAMKNSIIEQ